MPVILEAGGLRALPVRSASATTSSVLRLRNLANFSAFIGLFE